MLRSGDRPGAEQETWALLTLYQLLRMAMVTAIEIRPGTDPDRASLTTALEAARDQLTAAAGIIPADPGQPGVIARAILSTLPPTRRPLSCDVAPGATESFCDAPPWVSCSLGLLRRAAATLAVGCHGAPADMQTEILTGFLAAMRALDPDDLDRVPLAPRQCRAVQQAGQALVCASARYTADRGDLPGSYGLSMPAQSFFTIWGRIIRSSQPPSLWLNILESNGNPPWSRGYSSWASRPRGA